MQHKDWIIRIDGPFFVVTNGKMERRFRTRGEMADFLAKQP